MRFQRLVIILNIVQAFSITLFIPFFSVVLLSWHLMGSTNLQQILGYSLCGEFWMLVGHYGNYCPMFELTWVLIDQTCHPVDS